MSVLERNVIQPGKVLVREGEENARAYVLQNGEIAAYKKVNDEKVLVATYGPGTIIGEIDLVIDEPSKLSYEATVGTTVVTITRQDFQKRLSRADKSVQTILEHIVKKVIGYQREETEKALKNSEIDDTARALVNSLLASLSEDKKQTYEHILLKHINGLIVDLKQVKQQQSENKD